MSTRFVTDAPEAVLAAAKDMLGNIYTYLRQNPM
jgi:hypothetical protein